MQKIGDSTAQFPQVLDMRVVVQRVVLGMHGSDSAESGVLQFQFIDIVDIPVAAPRPEFTAVVLAVFNGQTEQKTVVFPRLQFFGGCPGLTYSIRPHGP